MKKIIGLLLLTLCFTVGCNIKKSNAQIKMYKSTSTIAGITTQTNDSVTNTETTYFSTRTGDLIGKDFAKYRIDFKVDTTSGTPTTINIVVQGSMDGIKWFNFSGAPLGVDGFNCDSLTITTAANERFTINEMPGTTKFANGTLRGNVGTKTLFIRCMIVAASGTHNTVFSDFRLFTSQ